MQTGKRGLPRALYHVTTARRWRDILADGTLRQGEGYGWEERKGVFALSWNNWALGKLHYLAFLIMKLRGRNDGLVVLRIEMNSALIDKTSVALLSPADSETGKVVLEKARAGCFSDIRSESDLVLLRSMGSTLIRNTFPLREFVMHVPPANDPIEYIIESDVPVGSIEVAAAVQRADIPANIKKSSRLLARRIAYRKAHGNQSTRRIKPVITAKDRQEFVRLLYASRKRLAQ